MAQNAGDVVVRRNFEAYLLWLFGWVMFLGSHGDSVDKHYVRYARELADLPVDEIPSYAWGPAVLCATYRALCDACHRVQDSSILSGCPLLLQLWSLERFQIGRPQLDLRAYEDSLYVPDDELDRPTMGTVWCRRRVSFMFIYFVRIVITISCAKFAVFYCTGHLRADHFAGVVPGVRCDVRSADR